MNEVRELANTARDRVLEDVIRILEEEISKNTDEAIKEILLNIKDKVSLLLPITRGATRGFGPKSFR